MQKHDDSSILQELDDEAQYTLMDFEGLEDIKEVKAKVTPASKALKRSQNWFVKTVGPCPICEDIHLFKSRTTGETLVTAMLSYLQAGYF